MGDVAYSDLKTRNDMAQYGRIGIFTNGSFPGTADNTLTNPNFATGTVLAPTQLVDRISDYDRKRTGIAAAGQWRSNDHKWLATVQYLRSYYSNENDEHAVTGNFFSLFGQSVRYRFSPSNLSTALQAPGSPNFTFDQNGMVQSGTFAQQVGWWGNPFDPITASDSTASFGLNSSGQPMFNACYTWSGCSGPVNTYGAGVGSSTRFWKDREMTQDASLNLKWEPTDDLRFNLDGQYINATVKNYDVTVDLNSFANIALDTSGAVPTMLFSAPTNVNQSPGGLSNPNNWYINDVMDHLEDSKGHEYALRGDGEYDFHSDWLSSLKFGARWADRKQLLQWSTYNWHNVSNTWTGGCAYTYFNLDSKPAACANGTSPTFKGYPAGFYEVQPFGSPFGGNTQLSVPFVPFDFLRQGGANGFSSDVTGVGDFIPICQRNGQRTGSGGTAAVELPNSCFTPDEVGTVQEKTKAVYAMLKFGGDNAKIPGSNWTIHGNIGLRYIDTVDTSIGHTKQPNPPASAGCPSAAIGGPLVPGGLVGNATTPPAPPPGAPPNTIVTYPAECYLTGQQLAFANGAITNTSARNHFHDFLPSFNLRLDFTPKWLMRFAASKAMSRPDFGLLKNYLNVTQSTPTVAPIRNTNGTCNADPRWVLDANCNPIGVNPTYNATAYNPFLKPITAWQFDASLEHYFGNAGQFSLAVFHKTFKNYIQSGSFVEDITSGGVTRSVIVTGPSNGKGAKIDGFEVAYNTFFDFLPGPLSGLGLQANYTYVKNKGVPNSNLSSVGSNGSTVNGQNGGTALNVSRLEGISTHTANIIGLYEKGRVSARLAYNWRSKFLVTPIDCCIALPVWQKATGYLDGSIRFRVTDSIELSVEGQNLLNTKAVLMQQVTDEASPEKKSILYPESWNQSDRRFIVGVRWKLGK
jgi:TonB-dependent receptor